MDTYPIVAIIILTKSNVQMLLNALNSVTQNCDYNNYMIYVVDTGSSLEEKQEIYKNIPDPLHTKFIELPSYHFGKNNNLVVLQHIIPETELLLFMNNDVIWINDCLSLMVDAYKKYPNIGTLGARLLYPNGRVQHAGMLLKGFEDFIIKPGHIGWGEVNKLEYEKTYPVIGNTAALMMISKEVFNQIKGFPIKYLECLEDVELNLRCLLIGKQNYYAGHVAAFHLESATRNKYLDMSKNTYLDLTERLMPFVRLNWSVLEEHMISCSHNLKKEEWSFANSSRIYSEYLESETVSLVPDFTDKTIIERQDTFEKRYALSSSDNKLHVVMIGHNNGCGYIRMEIPAKYLNISQDIVAFPTQKITPEIINWAHMFVWQAPVMFSTLNLMKTLKDTNKPQILEIDDNLLAMPIGVKTRLFVGKQEVKDMLQEANHMTVTMDTLGKYYKDNLPDVTPEYTVLPNSLDFQVFPASSYTPSEDILRIGWMGGASHFEDLQVVTEALKELQKKYKEKLEIHIIGWDGRLDVGDTVIDALDNLGRLQTPFKSIPEYYKTLVNSKLDLIFIPLAENDFNLYGKSPLKFLEGSAAKIPCVLSKSPVFSFVKHKETAYITEDPLDWFTAIDEMLTDKDLRVFLSENAYRYTKDNFDIVKHVNKWATLYRKIASSVYSYKIEKNLNAKL